MINKHPRAGKIAIQSDLINVAQLISKYYVLKPDCHHKEHKVKFGTSGHRGSSENYTFNEVHILAITQAIVEKRKNNGITGPCYVGKDTHALSEPAVISVLEVLVANNIHVIIQKNNGYTPTPVISNAIIEHNKYNKISKADGIIITPSHNPPKDGGIKYNVSNGGPANHDIIKKIENRANQLINDGLKAIKRFTIEKAWLTGYIQEKDLVQPYVENLKKIIDIESIKKSDLKIGIDPLGSSGIDYWYRISEYYKLNLTILNNVIDQTFKFMHLDNDGQIRIDCSSKAAMTGVLNASHKFDLILTNDPDNDRHGIISSNKLMPSNHYLAISINYLLKNRLQWSKKISIGKTIVSSFIIDKVVYDINRSLIEVPVGFRWFTNGLFNGTLGFCGEESSGASFLCFDGKPWSTDKDGIIMCLLAAELTAVTHKTPEKNYKDLIEHLGCDTSYNRLQISITNEEKKIFSKYLPTIIQKTLGDDPIINYCNLTLDNTFIDGFKITTKNGWCVVRQSGTEDICKVYCESFINKKHRKKMEKSIIKFIKNFF